MSELGMQTSLNQTQNNLVKNNAKQNKQRLTVFFPEVTRYNPESDPKNHPQMYNVSADIQGSNKFDRVEFRDRSLDASNISTFGSRGMKDLHNIARDFANAYAGGGKLQNQDSIDFVRSHEYDSTVTFSQNGNLVSRETFHKGDPSIMDSRENLAK
ncbi:MAG: hypothetical protein QNJ31_04095 [Candidatus Caenarcaniphilales bacterium]|nr:hypothetical protein [Candidatus Caenarcaniphilales bacterium]